eukprot:5361254-Alexandrium_andersonii.AAC.1
MATLELAGNGAGFELRHPLAREHDEAPEQPVIRREFQKCLPSPRRSEDAAGLHRRLPQWE